MNKEIKETLRMVVGSRMMAPTLKQLAEWLGYPSRSTLYRIIEGTAGDSAVAGLMARIEGVYGFDRSLLEEIAEVIELGEKMRRLAGACGRRRACAIIKELIAGRMEAFGEEEKVMLQRLEEEKRELFYAALSYFYLMETGARVYDAKQGFAARSVKIVTEIGDEIVDMYPENDAGANVLLIIGREDYFERELPILWSLVDPLATFFRFYAHPGDSYQSQKGAQLLPGVSERAFWRSRDECGVLIMTQVESGPCAGSGSYRIFRVAGDGVGDIQFVGGFSFLDDSLMVLRIPQRDVFRYGEYGFDGTELKLNWGGDDPLGYGLRWELQNPAMSQTVRQLLRVVTPERLERVHLEASGGEEVREVGISDVILSRREFRLELTDGRRLTLPLEAFPFLETLTAREPVKLVRLKINGEICVSWPRQMMTIPLERFEGG